MSDIAEPWFSWVVVPPGKIAVVRNPSGPWPGHIGITDDLLNEADPDYLTHGDGMVRFTLTDDTALYGYAHPDETPGVHHYDLLAEPQEGEK